MSESLFPLSKLKVGESGVIVQVNLKGSARQRFLAMGLVKGETISVERVAPLGDPIDFVVKNYHLSLRKSEANEIFVQAVSV
jgi:ferrous iron transport protein A